VWCIDGSLKDAFPELYCIARVKDVGALKKKKKFNVRAIPYIGR
jgi:hypothetical protein